VVFGERIRPSPYSIEFNKDAEVCKVACTKTYDSSNAEDKKKLAQLKKGMSMNYQHHWIVDNMPVSWQKLTQVSRLNTHTCVCVSIELYALYDFSRR